MYSCFDDDDPFFDCPEDGGVHFFFSRKVALNDAKTPSLHEFPVVFL